MERKLKYNHSENYFFSYIRILIQKMRNTKNIILIFILINPVCSCISKKQVSGNYIETKMGDSLTLFLNGTYAYNEKLFPGQWGWTKGTWNSYHQKINFTCDHKPLVSYAIKAKRDSSVHQLEFNLFLAFNDNPVYIQKAYLYKNKQILGTSSFKIYKNKIQIFATDYDSVLITTFNFPEIVIPKLKSTNIGYRVNIYAAERLYELDKVLFKKRKNFLLSTKKDEYENIELSFKKLNN